MHSFFAESHVFGAGALEIVDGLAVRQAHNPTRKAGSFRKFRSQIMGQKPLLHNVITQAIIDCFTFNPGAGNGLVNSEYRAIGTFCNLLQYGRLPDGADVEICEKLIAAMDAENAVYWINQKDESRGTQEKPPSEAIRTLITYLGGQAPPYSSKGRHDPYN